MSIARYLAIMIDIFVSATPSLTDSQRARLQEAYEALIEFDAG